MDRPSFSTRAGIAAASVLFLALSGVAPLLLQTGVGLAAHAQCSDGIDNDRNGRTDFPQDGSCDSIDDNFEGQGTSALFVSLTDGKEAIRQGDSLIYIISLLQQREELRDVDVDFHIPAEVDLIGVSGGGDILGDRVVWDRLTLAKNVTKQLTVQARVRTTARIDSLIVASVSSDGVLATDTTRVDGPQLYASDPSFRVTISDGQEFAKPQSVLTFVMRAENISGQERSARVQALLPASVGLYELPAGAELQSHKLSWGTLTFRPDELREFTFRVRIPERVVDYLPLYTRAVVDGASAADTTFVRTGFAMNALDVHIEADRDAVAPGELLTYTVSVDNTTGKLAPAAAANASLPVYSEFVSVSDGGFWDGRSIHWRNLQIAPHAARAFTYTVRVRPDAPIGNRLLASADADGAKDSVFSIVTDERSAERTASRSTRSPRSAQRGLLTKTANHSEVLPGGRIRYTLTVHNVLLHPIRDAVVTDRFDASFLTVIDQGGASITGNGSLEWRVPELAAGQEWSKSYVLAVRPGVAHGVIVNNVALIEGADIADASVSERVSVTKTGVVAVLPPTGAPLDLLATLFLFPLSLAPALVQRRRMI